MVGYSLKVSCNSLLSCSSPRLPCFEANCCLSITFPMTYHTCQINAFLFFPAKSSVVVSFVKTSPSITKYQKCQRDCLRQCATSRQTNDACWKTEEAMNMAYKIFTLSLWKERIKNKQGLILESGNYIVIIGLHNILQNVLPFNSRVCVCLCVCLQ